MKTTPRSDEAARRVSTRTLLKPGWHDARISEAFEKLSRAGNECIELTVLVGDRTLRDWLVNNDRGAAKLRNCCNAVDALARYEAGEIAQEDFGGGHDVQVKIGVEKRRGFPDQNRIEDYRPGA